jgi:hypothetical protein
MAEQIVLEAGWRQLLGPRATADLVRCLHYEYEHRAPGARRRHRRGKAAGPGADDPHPAYVPRARFDPGMHVAGRVLISIKVHLVPPRLKKVPAREASVEDRPGGGRSLNRSASQGSCHVGTPKP